MSCSPLNQLGLLLFWLWRIETPLALLQVEVKVGGGDAVETTHMTLGLIPEVLDAVDVVLLIGEQFGVVDAVVLETRNIEHVVGAEGIGVDDAVGDDLVLDDGLQRLTLGVRDDLGIDLAAAFEQAKHGNLATGPATALALAMASEVALVHFDLAEQRRAVFALQGDDLAQTMKIKRCRALVDSNQRSRRPSRRSGHEMLDQTPLNRPRQTALAHRQTILSLLHSKVVI